MRRVLLAILSIFLTFSSIYAGGKKEYQTKIMSGTIFTGIIFNKNQYPQHFNGFIPDNDSVVVLTKNTASFLKSIYEKSKFVAQGIYFFQTAYSKIFDKSYFIKDDNNNAISVVQDYLWYYNEECEKYEKTIEFDLDSGSSIQISYCHISSCFAIFPITSYENGFNMSNDIDISKISKINCIWVPIGAFSFFYSNSNVFTLPNNVRLLTPDK